ncbi:class I SAM-dependent methyltransferase [Chitinophaga pendula]|uniref:class I SAM-dependent methyltransferase n=1 Tax=Chitinophaga TaxID=79328 RepID=UPI000BAED906|nr:MULTISPECIES: class I SAM-dependent methyltransferase [Chitinophaga]ASZ09942.1 hypothetical protein CK934_02570 [Chitinophaga sp. MD30]UCJ07118.1 class I SAM-dependent methyltransferase [Chitinophaga pendula]
MRYLLYFLYVSWHWGVALALFIVRHEIKGERKYGIRTIGTDNLTGDIPKEDIEHVSMYEPINYYTATWLFDRLTPADRNTAFIDIGCGKGRVLAIAAAYGFPQVIGIEYSPKLCRLAQPVCDALKQRHPGTHISVIQADARVFDLPDNIGVIFLFNPFDETIMKIFIEKVMESLRRKKRPLKVLYANPQCKQLWLDTGFRESEHFVKLVHLKGGVLEI